MFILCYYLQGHLQLALWEQRGPGQGQKGSASWPGEEPGQDRCKSYFIVSVFNAMALI